MICLGDYSTNQYKTQFRKWDFRKNGLTAQELENAPCKKRKMQAIEPPLDEIWEAHKEVMQQLYFSSPLKELIGIMKSKHNFTAS